MNKIIIGRDCSSNITINSDSDIIITSEVQSKNINFNILNCKVKIIDMGLGECRSFNFQNSEANIVDIINNDRKSKLNIDNDNSIVEYNLIDLFNKDINYVIEGSCNSGGSSTTMNLASVCYKDKIKNYVINTSNKEANTVNEINCFGIVKDKSILNYDVSSLILKGSKKSVVRQNSNILLFDEKSVGKNNPVLLIEENDVKASHGSSIGKIDDDTMFYLCSRGLSKNEATNLICLGKLEYLIKKIEDQEIKESLITEFRERMS